MKRFVGSLPPDFQGSVFIVLHIPADTTSMLSYILAKAGPLEVIEPLEEEYIRPGKIYIAINNHHLLIEKGKVFSKKGPKENRFRPSIDALFRSAAYEYGPRVIGIVLSGLLNDGTSGLWSVKRMGGIAIIQDPNDAEYPQMPENVIEYVSIDHSVRADQMGELLNDLIGLEVEKRISVSEDELQLLKTEVVIAKNDNAFELGIMQQGEFTPFTCPACHGSLVKIIEGNIIRFRCHTGHAYTASALLSEVTESVEDMLWQSMRGLEETTMLLRNIENHFKELGEKEASNTFRKKADQAAHRARLLRDSVFRQEQFSEDIRLERRIRLREKEKNNGLD